MQTELRRRGDRIAVALPIQVTGTDAEGQLFDDRTRTVSISRHGAKIFLARALNPHQELGICSLGTGQNSKAVVIWKVKASPEGYHYGINISDPEISLWGINFRAPTESEIAAARVLLECTSCHVIEVGYLTHLDLEVFMMSQRTSLACERCNDITTWTRPSLYKLLAEPALTAPEADAAIADLATADAAVAEPPPATLPRTENERIEPRLDLKVTGCIQTSYYGEEVVVTEDVSEGGFSFKSPKQYAVGVRVEVALPYVKQGGNVFVPAQIMWAQYSAEEGVTIYGVSYVQARRRAKRVKPSKPVPVAFIGGGIRKGGTIVDLGMSGVMVRTGAQIPIGTNVRMGIEAGFETIRIAAVARRHVTDVGTAFEFLHMSSRDRQLLRRLIFRFGSTVAF